MTDHAVTFRGYTGAALRLAWDKVKDPTDWRGTVVVLVHAACVDIVCAAIVFFTATDPVVFAVDGDFCLVVAAGYRLGPAGDH